VRIDHLHFPVSQFETAHLTLAVKADTAEPASGGRQASADADESRLIDGLRRGERSALEAMILRHRPVVSRLVARLNSWSGDSEDLVQEVFLAALHGAGRFRGNSRISTWLMRICINVCRQHHRTRMLRAKFWKTWLTNPESAPTTDASQHVEQNERSQRVTRAVGRLKGKYREVVVLHYLQEMSIDDVAAVLKLSRGAVEMRLHRARQMLGEMLGPALDKETT
jgi:RNA polymerase sigma-70 factor (ECF subfamily)